MSRRRKAEKRKIIPDARFKNVTIAKFINCVMKQGKKSVAEMIVYGALDSLGKVTKKNALEAFQQALANVRPAMEVRSRRIGGATYQVPVEVRDVRSLALAIRWLIKGASGRGEKTMREKLAGEFSDAFNGRGVSVKKREDTHKMAESNRAFAHYKF